MDESDGSCYTRSVNRLRFIAALLAFLIPLAGSLPSLANDTLWTGSSAGRARADALVKATTIVFGFKRAAAAISGVIRERVEAMVSSGRITAQNGIIRRS